MSGASRFRTGDASSRGVRRVLVPCNDSAAWPRAGCPAARIGCEPRLQPSDAAPPALLGVAVLEGAAGDGAGVRSVDACRPPSAAARLPRIAGLSVAHSPRRAASSLPAPDDEEAPHVSLLPAAARLLLPSTNTGDMLAAIPAARGGDASGLLAACIPAEVPGSSFPGGSCTAASPQAVGREQGRCMLAVRESSPVCRGPRLAGCLGASTTGRHSSCSLASSPGPCGLGWLGRWLGPPAGLLVPPGLCRLGCGGAAAPCTAVPGLCEL